MKIKIMILFVLLVQSNLMVSAQNKPAMSEIDRIRLAEAFRLSASLSDAVWKDWSRISFPVLLITPDYEFLIRHPQPSQDFTLIGYDLLLKSNVYFRKRVLSPNFLATFPAVGGITTVVVGQAENTGSKTSTPWVVTLLHEHFHQLQDLSPNINAETEALNLSRGDRTGMWMLNYAFPYDSPEIKQQFIILSRALADALQAENKNDFSAKLKIYLDSRERLQKMLSSDDNKYFSFQLWKEGIARYTEYQIALTAAAKYKPSKTFRRLKDYTSFQTTAQAIRNKIIAELTTLRLENYQRVAFYPIGAGEGLLLDKANPNWHGRYFTEKFYLEKYFAPLR